jgi:hypothetical protein
VSLAQVLETTRAALVDRTVGLAAQMTALAGTQTKVDPELIRTDFNFVKWRLSSPTNLQQTTTPNVMTRPAASSAGHKNANLRDAAHRLEVSIEFFDADVDVLEANVETATAALIAVFSGLPEFSLANGGTIVEVIAPFTFAYGDFATLAGATDPVSAGLTATVSIQERSTL